MIDATRAWVWGRIQAILRRVRAVIQAGAGVASII